MMRPQLLVTDVDGTLVRHDRTLAPSTVAAAHRLREAGVKLALVSSRPPGGLDVLRGPLAIDPPCAGFNGALVQDASGRVVVERTIPEEVCREAVTRLEQAGLDVWIFARGEWLLKNEAAVYIPREQLSISMGWRVVSDLHGDLGAVHKVMGSSPDFAKVATAAADLRMALGEQAKVLLSQDYYIDITHPKADKGEAALAIAALLGVAPDAMACIGDMPNDLPMFAVAGLSIAMGNAPAEVKAQATMIVASNDDNGWAEAVAQLLLQ
jgi:Cof subfamily protein (haloacid dehalogenase superfamily)